jgi:hypothetical protein
MNKSIGMQLTLFSFVLAAGGWYTHRLAPALGAPTLVASLAGAALCLVWGAWTLAGGRRKAPAVLTLTLVSFVLLSQAVLGWWHTGEPVPGRHAAAATSTLLLLLCTAMLMRVAYAGVSFAQPPPPSAREMGPRPAAESPKSSRPTPWRRS